VEKDGELARELEEEHGGHGGEDEGLVWNWCVGVERSLECDLEGKGGWEGVHGV
jgi:hypothetical protein